MDVLKRIALEYAAEAWPVENLPQAAVDALMRDVDSPALRELAGLPRSAVHDIRDTYLLAMDELGITVPTMAAATWGLVVETAQQVIAGSMPPIAGAGRIRAWLAHVFPDAAELGELEVLSAIWDDQPSSRIQCEQSIVEAVRRLVEHGQPTSNV